MSITGETEREPGPFAQAEFRPGTRGVVLTISDRCSRGEQQDRSGPAVVELLATAGLTHVTAQTLSDDLDQIAGALRHHAASGAVLIVTTGGTGLGPRDVTPEATRLVCERFVEGLAERMRSEGSRQTTLAALSRGVCGVVAGSSSLVINLPGSPSGATTSLAAILPLVPHAVDLLAGYTRH